MIKFWKISTVNGKRFCFCDAAEDTLFEGDLYKANQFLNSDEVKKQVNLAKETYEFEAGLNIPHINGEDIKNGLFNNAIFEYFIIKGQAKKILKYGQVNSVEIKNKCFVLEIQTLSRLLDKNLNEIYSPLCRAEFGDDKCKINRNNYKHIIKMQNIVSSNELLIEKISANFELIGGLINFKQLSEINQAQENYQYKITMVKPVNFNHIIITVDKKLADNLEKKISSYQASITPNCSKTFSACQSFNNVINFRGEPDLPGIEKLLQIK